MNPSIQIDIGLQGTGKSTHAYHSARLSGKSIVLFDPAEQFDFTSRGGSTVETQSAFEDAIDAHKFPVVYRPGLDVRRDNVKPAFEDFSEVLIEKSGFAILIDEARFLMSAQGIIEALSVLFRTFRQREHSIFLTAHTVQDFHRDAFTPARTVCFFRADRKTKTFDAIADNFGQEIAEKVFQLRGFDFLEWTNDPDIPPRIVRDAESWREQISPQKPRETSRAAA